jgi:hypothetical protein
VIPIGCFVVALFSTEIRRFGIEPASAKSYDGCGMNVHWRRFAVIMLLVAMAMTLVHWHLDLDGQRCELCRVQHLPTLYTPVQNPLATPAVEQWHALVFEAGSRDRDHVTSRFGRAPPRSVFA